MIKNILVAADINLGHRVLVCELHARLIVIDFQDLDVHFERLGSLCVTCRLLNFLSLILITANCVSEFYAQARA